MSRLLFAGLLSFFGLVLGMFAGLRPPNDEFADRIVLQGDAVTFLGTPAGATSDPMDFGMPRNIWWSWTATQTAPVTIEIWAIRNELDLGTWTGRYTWLAVYSPSNLASGFPTNWNEPSGYITQMTFLPEAIHPTLTFTGYAGRTYQIQLAGATSADYDMSLTSTTIPIVRQHPRTTSAAEHESVLFTVAATGALPLSYHWLLGETPLAGETGPTLVITNVGLSNAGDYSVVISNGLGYSTSAVAHLFVNATPQAPRLVYNGRPGTNGINVGFTGEPGRFYRVETSSDFIHWTTETNFISKHLLEPGPATNGFVLSSNGVSALQVPTVTDRTFIRLVRYAPADEVCNVHLKQFRFLKNLWAMHWQKQPFDMPQDIDLFTGYNTPKPRCPQGGLYTLGSMDSAPRCSIPGHVLEEPQ